MPFNHKAVGTRSEPGEQSWSSTDALVYALGVGAGAEDLAFTTENTAGVPQQVLPTMSVILNKSGSGRDEALGDFDRTRRVHGEQSFRLHRTIPIEGRVRSVATIVGIFDKGSGAVVVTETDSVDAVSGEPMWSTRSSMFFRGQGGWGGDRGPSGGVELPERDPDHVITDATTHDQALRYRLSGDRNPLHSDPAFAAARGFAQPILHGLCTFGFSGRALLRTLCGNDATRLQAMGGRFSAPLTPGDLLRTEVWVTSEGEAAFRTSRTDGTVVIDGGSATFL